MGIPHGHWKTTTFVTGLRTTGIVAPLVLDGPINGEAFEAYVQQVLVPTLHKGDIVVMDMGLRGISDGVAELKGISDWTQYLHVIDRKLAAVVGRLLAGSYQRLSVLTHLFSISSSLRSIHLVRTWPGLLIW